MALDATCKADLCVSRSPRAMRAAPQQPGPNGPRVIKKGPSPRLGDGLCDTLMVVIDSPARSEETYMSTVDHETGSSVFTSSGRASASTPSTPDSISGFFDFGLRIGANGHLEPFNPPVSSISCRESSLATPCVPDGVNLLLQKQSRLSLVANAFTSPSPCPRLNARGVDSTAVPKMSKGSKTDTPLAPAPTVQEILVWLRGGKLTSLEAKVIAKTYQHWDLLQALDSQELRNQRTTSNSQPSPVSQDQQESFIPNPLYSSVHLCKQSSIETMRDRFYMKLKQYTDTNNAGPDLNAGADIHIFVDMSNIFIGFCESYKVSRQIPLSRRISVPQFSFKTFAVVMERARNIQKRVLAGSVCRAVDKNSRAYWPRYFLEAEQLNYQMNVFSRVRKRKVSPNKVKGRGRTPSERTDEVEDTYEDATYEIRNGEQGVDENLHLNMMDSMWENLTCPGTMVLATGDAAEAEFSGGFLKYAIRALEKGWRLELVTWKRPLSSAWTDPKFLEKYGHRFTIIFLDDFLEELYTDLLA